MDWLTQNWIWIVLAIGGFFMLRRMGGMGGCGTGHSSAHGRHEGDRENAPPAAGNRPGALFDPVSRHTFTAGNAPFSTVHGGRAFYFESRENRDAFEADPDKYLAAAPNAGDVMEAEHGTGRPRRRRGGC